MESNFACAKFAPQQWDMYRCGVKGLNQQHVKRGGKIGSRTKFTDSVLGL
jgi:hypothetical protein